MELLKLKYHVPDSSLHHRLINCTSAKDYKIVVANLRDFFVQQYLMFSYVYLNCLEFLILRTLKGHYVASLILSGFLKIEEGEVFRAQTTCRFLRTVGRLFRQTMSLVCSDKEFSNFKPFFKLFLNHSFKHFLKLF